MSARAPTVLCAAALLSLACQRRGVVAEAAVPRKALPPPTAAELALPPPVSFELALPPPPDSLPPFIGSAERGPDGYAAQTVDRVALLSLLFDRDFEKLNRTIEDLQLSFESDYRKEFWPLDACDSFDSTDPRLGPLLDEWVRTTPGSFAPWMSRGAHRVADAWFYRGDRSISETTPEQLAAFERRLEPAVADLRKALSLRPRLVAALRKLLQISRSGMLRPQPLLREAIRICPECFQPRVAYMVTLFPEWGGSIEAMQIFAGESAAESSNPRLGLLRGFVPWYQSGVAMRSRDLPAALAACDKALSGGDYWEFRYRRAIIKDMMRADESALEDLDRAVELRPGIGYVREYRAVIATRLGLFERAADDLILALRLEPTMVPQKRIPPVVHGLTLQSRRATERGDAAAAGRLLELARILDPSADAGGGSETPFASSADSGGPSSAAPDWLRSAPKDVNSRSLMERTLYQQGRDEDVIELWTDYTNRHPDDPRGYLRRAQAWQRLKEREKAMADWTRACDLGSKQACDHLAFLAWKPEIK